MGKCLFYNMFSKGALASLRPRDAVYVFLGLNDFDLTATQAQVVEVMLEVASGSMDEAELGKWLRVHARAID